MRERLIWICIGAVGLVLAAGLGLAAGELTSTPVGISAEPVSAGEALAPKATATAAPRRRPKATPTPAPTAAATADDDNSGSDDSSGRGRGRGRGRSGDDD
jgi:hypothetical protein